MFTLKNVSWGVGSHQILHDIDLQIGKGESIGIVGPNGCGKTSLLNTLNGFNIPWKGKINYKKTDVTKFGVEKRAVMGIGRVFQSFGIFKGLTLYENLALAYVHRLGWKYKLLPLKFLPKKYKKEILEVLDTLDLKKKKDEKAGELSGGQMRLLEIARLYLQDAEIFLLDEPTAGVSPKLKKKVIALLKKILATGKTVIIVEHDFHFLGEFVDRLVVMNDGRVVMDGKYKDLKDSKKLQEVYFG